MYFMYLLTDALLLKIIQCLSSILDRQTGIAGQFSSGNFFHVFIVRERQKLVNRISKSGIENPSKCNSN